LVESPFFCTLYSNIYLKIMANINSRLIEDLNQVLEKISSQTGADTIGESITRSNLNRIMYRVILDVLSKNGGGGTPIEEHVFDTVAERDAYFNPDRLDELVVGTPILVGNVDIGGGTLQTQIQMWAGTSNPSTYDNTDWALGGSSNLTGAQISALLFAEDDTNNLTDALLAVIQGISGLSENRVPIMGASGLEDSGIRMMADGNLFIPTTVKFESDSIEVGDLARVSGSNSFLTITNPQFPGISFDVIDARRRTTTPSERPRHFFLTEGERDLIFQPDRSSQVTSNPVTMPSVTPSDLQVNSFDFETFAPMTNVRVKLSYTDGEMEDVKFLPSEEVWLDGAGGLDFITGINTIDFEDSPIRSFTGDNLIYELRADSVSLLGSSSGQPYLLSRVQGGEFRDIAYESDTVIDASGFDGNLTTSTTTLQELAQAVDDLATGSTPNPTNPSVHNFAINIPSRVDLNTDLNNERTLTYSISNRDLIQSLELIVTGGDNKTLTIPTADGAQTQSVILTGIDTSSNTTLSFQLRITDTDGQTHNSNTRSVSVRDLIPAEQLQYGFSQTATPTPQEISAGTEIEADTGTTFEIQTTPPVGEYLFIRVPSDHDIRSISTLGINVRSAFVRTVDSVNNVITYTDGAQTGVPIDYNIILN